MPTNPHPTARALVEAWIRATVWPPSVEESVDDADADALADRIALALTAARQEGRREMRELAADIASKHGISAYRLIRQLPLDDAARGEEPSHD